MITKNIDSIWSVHTPVVFRFMQRLFVEDFFSTGKLRLSSMHEFRKNEDEKLRDGHEGIYQIVGHYSDGLTSTGIAQGGYKSFILCGSTHEMHEQFGKNAAIQIFDTTAFGIAISKCIPGFQRGVEGFCIYNKLPVEYLVPAGLTFQDIGMHLEISGNEVEDNVNAFTAGLRTAQDNALYFKKQSRFSQESEYRWVWLADKLISKTLDVECPAAREFCRPLFFN